MTGAAGDRPAGPLDVFVSYSHVDQRWRAKLGKHLSTLEHEGVIRVWHDRKIVAGSDWSRAIDESLVSADVVLLLVSSDFLASRYAYGIEMNAALERHRQGSAVVIPVILRDCEWQREPFGALQACPTDAKPVARWTDKDAALVNVAQGIRRAAAELHAARAAAATGAPTAELARALDQQWAVCAGVGVPVQTFHKLLVTMRLDPDYVGRVFDVAGEGVARKVETWLRRQAEKQVLGSSPVSVAGTRATEDRTVVAAQTFAAAEGAPRADVRHFLVALLSDDESRTVQEMRKSLNALGAGGFEAVRRAAAELRPTPSPSRSDVSALDVSRGR